MGLEILEVELLLFDRGIEFLVEGVDQALDYVWPTIKHLICTIYCEL